MTKNACTFSVVHRKPDRRLPIAMCRLSKRSPYSADWAFTTRKCTRALVSATGFERCRNIIFERFRFAVVIIFFRVSGKLMAKQKVALECLSYHATASIDDTIKLAQDTIPSAETYNLYRYPCETGAALEIAIDKVFYSTGLEIIRPAILGSTDSVGHTCALGSANPKCVLTRSRLNLVKLV